MALKWVEGGVLFVLFLFLFYLEPAHIFSLILLRAENPNVTD